MPVIRMKRYMARWQWEICKMFLYMSFPVTCFHYFNSPQIFEEEVTKLKRIHYPPTTAEHKAYVENLIQETNAKLELKALNQLEAAKRQKLTI